MTFRVEASDDLVALLDSDRMRQAVDNLLHNASRFAPVGSEIVMAGSARGHDLVIEVSDSGPGFPPEFLPHAFERFSRPDSGRARAGGGTGLGLSIVQAIATAHGGKALAPQQGRGWCQRRVGAARRRHRPVSDGFIASSATKPVLSSA